MRTRMMVALLSLLVCASVASAQMPSAPKKLTLEMYWDWETVSDPQVSPDGKQIVYTRGWRDKMNDRNRSSLWVMNSDGSKNRFLTEGSGARWSPDGTRIAFTRDGEPRGSQIWVRWMDAESATTQITRVERSPSAVTWSPDGQSIGFTMIVPKRESWNIRLPQRPEGARWVETPRIIESVTYRRDRVGFLQEGFTHIFTVPAGGGTPRQITSGNFNHGGAAGFGGGGQLAWTPDGKEILLSSNRTPDWDLAWRETDIYAVNVMDGTFRQLTKRSGPDGSPEISPDGKWVAYTGYDMTDDTWVDSKLYLMGIDGSSPRVLTPNLDRTPGSLTWAADGSGIYFTTTDKGTRNVWFVSTKGEVKQLTQGSHMLSLDSMASNGFSAGVLSSPHKPGDVVSFSLPGGAAQIKQLTNVNDDVLEGVKLGDVEEIWYTSVDNMKIHGWIIKPPDFAAGKKYPLQLVIHGGPHSSYNADFNFGWQEMASNGYVVLYTNPRGSTSYGSAFGNAIKFAYPSKDYDDLMKGVDETIAKGYVDTRNMFVYGCSGGGVLTSWIVGKTDRFAAASANCPVTNWISFVGTTDGATWYRNFAKMPWEDITEHWNRSPLKYVGNVKTPTMLMTGVNDLRTPISQTEEFYEALRVRKIPTAMVRFNEEFHGTTSRPSNFLRTQLYLRYWFEKFITKDAQPQRTDEE